MKRKQFIQMILFLVVILLIIISFPFLLYRIYFNGSFSSSSTEWSDFGSYYGGTVSSLLGFLSTILILITVFLQKKAIDIQEDENSTKLYKLQSEIDSNSLQMEIIKQQSFENTLNNMISHKFSLVDSFAKGSTTGEQVINKKIFELIINDSLQVGNSGFDIITEESKQNKGREIFSELVGLFNFIISIGLYIEENGIKNKKYFYSRILYSLTDNEIKMLIFAKEKKRLNDQNNNIVNCILCDYKDISISDIEMNGAQSIHMVAAKKGIINLI